VTENPLSISFCILDKMLIYNINNSSISKLINISFCYISKIEIIQSLFTYIGAKNTKNEMTLPVHQIKESKFNSFANHKIHINNKLKKKVILKLIWSKKSYTELKQK
jgi:Mg2+/Co2+ transporter CorC